MPQLDIKLYIDQIQEEIAKTIKEVGIGKTREEIDEGVRRLHSRLISLSDDMAAKMGVKGDYNITNLMTTGIISLSWAEFILAAKSHDKKRPLKDRESISKVLASLQENLPTILQDAIRYGETYDKKSTSEREAQT